MIEDTADSQFLEMPAHWFEIQLMLGVFIFDDKDLCLK